MIRFADHHAERLLRMRPTVVMAAMGDEVAAGAQAIVELAQHNIRDGAISGHGHIAGLPGDFPNADTHELDASLHVGELVETANEIKSSAIASAPYAGYVELGTSRMEPRPYMAPTTEELRPDILRSMHKRYRSEVGIA